MGFWRNLVGPKTELEKRELLARRLQHRSDTLEKEIARWVGLEEEARRKGRIEEAEDARTHIQKLEAEKIEVDRELQKADSGVRQAA